jgi:hypothetical protein
MICAAAFLANRHCVSTLMAVQTIWLCLGRQFNASSPCSQKFDRADARAIVVHFQSDRSLEIDRKRRREAEFRSTSAWSAKYVTLPRCELSQI